MSTYPKLATWGLLWASLALWFDTAIRWEILLWMVLLYLAQTQQNNVVVKEAPSTESQGPQQRWWSSSNRWPAGFPWVKRAGMRTVEAHARPYLWPQHLHRKHPSSVVVTQSVICNLIKRFGDQISNLTSKIDFQSSVLRVCLVRHPAT